MQTHPVGSGEKLLRSSQVYERLGISRREFYRRVRSGEYPPGIYLTPTCRRWPESDIDKLIADKISDAAR